jgi:hypothetical protein
MLAIYQTHLNEIVSHARDVNPHECCGLIGSTVYGLGQTVYRLRNVAAEPLVTYEAAPEELFAAQRAMRDRGEEFPVPGLRGQSCEEVAERAHVRRACRPDRGGDRGAGPYLGSDHELSMSRIAESVK